MRTYLLLLFLLLWGISYGINDDIASDATSQAMGGISVAHTTPAIIINNPSLSTELSSPTVLASFTSAFSLDRMSVAAMLPLKDGRIGISLQRSGVLDYSEINYGLFYAHSFGNNFGASLQTNVFSVTPQGTAQTQWAISGNIGLWYKATTDITVGCHIFNILNAKYSFFYYDEQIPVNLKVGFTYDIFDNFTVAAEMENNSLHGTSIRGGIEYALSPHVYFRSGGGTNPVLASLGLGVNVNNIHIDIATQAVRTIGKTGAISIAYTF